MLRLVLIASIYITHVTSISSYSPLKKNLVSVARKLAEENEEQDADYSWLTDYSLKFSSCHTVSSLYDEEFGSYTQQLVQFRICPSDECSWRCNGGKYLVPMEDFLQGYADQKQADEDYACEQVMENCECDDNDEDDVDDGDDDGNNCEKNCYSDAGLDYCVDDDVSKIIFTLTFDIKPYGFSSKPCYVILIIIRMMKQSICWIMSSARKLGKITMKSKSNFL